MIPDTRRPRAPKPVPDVIRIASPLLPTPAGEFRAYGYHCVTDDIEHLALVLGNPGQRLGPLVRVHSECLTGDVFFSRRCDCGEQLRTAMDRIAAAGCGVLIYLRGHEGRGIGLAQKLRAYELQAAGLDTVDANLRLGFPVDGRNYGAAAAILRDLGVTSVRLLTNNPDKVAALRADGIRVVKRVPSLVEPNAHNARYLATKATRMHHLVSGNVRVPARRRVE
jgi:GTP cyclohydrolase II